ncbi:MAG: hypothetical protein LBG62_02395 [Candidatus Methanoplasma sp.]|jgi:lipoate-protein ligase A|nr:hypothetical protein [Candidatus Methanoplasma sp.]
MSSPSRPPPLRPGGGGRCRVFDAGALDPGRSVALDRAVFESRRLGLVPDTIFFYSRDRRTVSLGRFGSEGDVLPGSPEAAVVRRMSGGGTVLTGPGTLIASVALGGDIPPRAESFEMICGGIADALRSLGIDAEPKAPNDVFAGGGKISGGAQYRTEGCMIHHATVIVEKDPRTWEILGRKADYDLASVAEILGRAPPRREIASAVARGISRRLGMDAVPGEPTEREMRESGIRA